MIKRRDVAGLFAALVLLSGCKAAATKADATSEVCGLKADPAAALILASGSSSTKRKIVFAVGAVDNRKRRHSLEGDCDDIITRAKPGEREFSVQVMFVNYGLKDALEVKTGPYYAYINLKASVEQGKIYRVTGEVRDKSCFAWLENPSTGAKVSAEFSAVYAEPNFDMASPPIVDAANKFLMK